MALTMRPPAGMPPERILLYGKEGTGKTNAVLSIARRIPDARFHVIDTDYSASYERMLATEFDDVRERGNVEVSVVGPSDWAALMGEVRRIVGVIRRGDWLVIDSMTPTWQAVQEWYTEKVFGADGWEDYLLDVRLKREKAREKGVKVSSLEALDGWMDWSVINPTYFRLYKLTLGHLGNLIYTAEGVALGDQDKKNIRDTYGAVGLKPAGQKKIGFTTHTVLLTSKGRSGEYGLTTIKDRGREELDEVELENFAKDYLQKIAGWKPRPYKDEGE